MFLAPLLCVTLEPYSAIEAKGITAPLLCSPSREFTELGMTESINHEYGCLVTCYLGEAAEGVLHFPYHAAGSLLERKKQIPADAEQS